jgi:hypothetical protein
LNLDDFIDELPPAAFAKSSGPTVQDRSAPVDITPGMAETFVFGFGSRDVFPRLYKQLLDNSIVRDKLVTPSEYKGDLRDFFRNTPFLPIFKMRVSAEVSDEARFAGTWVIAPSGKGKTTLLHSLILQDLQTEASVILMDSKVTGDLIKPYKTLRAIRDDLIVIEPSPQLALNPLDLGRKQDPTKTIELLTYVFSALLETPMTPLQSTLFRQALRACLCYPKPTIKTLQQIIREGVPAHIKLPASVRDFFENEFQPKKGKGTYTETVQQIQWRLRLLLDNPIMEGMLNSPETKLDLAKAMNSKSVVVIDANKEKLGDLGSEFYQRLFIALILDAAQRRVGLQDWQRRPCFVYIDECQNAIKNDPKIVQILDECRSAKVGITLSHQRLDQIKDADVLSALFNCAVKYANPDNDASTLAGALRTSAEALRNMPNLTFAVHCRGVAAFNVTVPYFTPAQMPQMTDEEHREHLLRMAQYYNPGSTTEDEAAAKTDTTPASESTPEAEQRIEPETPQPKAEPQQTSDPDDISTEPSKDW